MTQFTVSAARPLPVILLADVSGSMAAEGKTEAMNQSVRDMLSTFAGSDDLRAESHVAIITFAPALFQDSLQALRCGIRPPGFLEWCRATSEPRA